MDRRSSKGGRWARSSTVGASAKTSGSSPVPRYAYPTQVLAASIRHPMHVLESARAGADVATIPYQVFKQLFRHPLTDVGVEAFERDWQKVLEKRKAHVRG
jgi:transaldolase